MIKKCFFAIIFLWPIITFASDSGGVKVGNKVYDNLSDALKNADSTDTIELFSDESLDETYTVDKVVNINLNGNNITSKSTSFLVKGGTLNISGKGTIKELEPNYGAIRVMGSENKSDSRYSSVNIENGVTLEGWSGIFVTHTNNLSYGVNVNLEGSIKAVSDINGNPGAGIYINGNIKAKENHPVINISDGAKIESNGTGLYIAGYTTVNINEATIQGKYSGIGIKSGILNIDGAKIICDGEDDTPTEGYNNGLKSSGTTIQIESNTGYAGNIELNFTSGNLISKNSNVIYEYIGGGDSTQVKNINITGGTFESVAKKDVISISNSLKSSNSSFISGGRFSSDPKEYLKSGYTTNLENNLYNVSKSAMAVFGEKLDNSNTLSNIIIFSVILVLLIISFINREKIINLFKKVIAR